MIDNYRQLQQWNQWLATSPLGATILEAEIAAFRSLTLTRFGKRTLLIGVPKQAALLEAMPFPLHSLISPLAHKSAQPTPPSLIEADFHELPLLSGSVDLVLLPHTLELVDNPRLILSEACRVIKPEGSILIAGFNPQSLWGIVRWCSKKISKLPKNHRLIPPTHLINWLKLADFELEFNKSTFFRPLSLPVSLHRYFNLIEPLVQTCFPKYGGIYILSAKAKVIPLTPIKMNWKQSLSSVRMAGSIPGHTYYETDPLK